MKIREGLVLSTALVAVAAGGCSAEQPAAPAQTSSPEATPTPNPGLDRCGFVVGSVALRDKATKTFEITGLYAAGKAPDAVCTPQPDTEVSVFDVSKVFTEPHPETGQTVRIGSEIVARCINAEPPYYLGIETAGHQDAVSFRGDVNAQITGALGAPLPNCFDLLPPAPTTK